LLSTDDSLLVSHFLERPQAARVARLGCGELALHVHQDAAIVLDDSKQSNVAGLRGEIGCMHVQPLALIEVASALGDDGQTVVAMRLAAHGSAANGVTETLLVAAIGGFRLALLPVESAFPSQGIGEKCQVALVAEKLDRLFVKSERRRGIATLL